MRAKLKVEKDVVLALEDRQKAEEEDNLRLKTEEEGRIAEEARMEAEE